MTAQTKAPVSPHRGHATNNAQSNINSLRPIDKVLSVVQNARRSGSGYRADCSNGHTQAKGTLSFTETPEGACLIHCFACGDLPGILNSLGLNASDLYPDRPKDMTPAGRRAAREAFKRNAWCSALRVLSHETVAVLVLARMTQRGEVLKKADWDRLKLAISRIEDAREVLA